jgi:hypothetical protein
MKSREIEQLLLVAMHYLSLAKRISRTDPAILECTVDQLASHHVDGKLQKAELILAHLASSGIRLATVCEKKPFAMPYRTAFYKKGKRKGSMLKADVVAQLTKDLCEHIHFLLRDAVAHEENVNSDMASDRADVLMPLTVKQVLAAIESCATRVRASV